MAYTRIVYDLENNAEIFFQALQDTPIPDEFVEIIDGLDQHLATGVCVEPALAQRFEAWVSELPGYADGPEHARTAILFYEGVEVEEDEEGEADPAVVAPLSYTKSGKELES